MVAAFRINASEDHSILRRTANRTDARALLDVDRKPTEPAAAAWKSTEFYLAQPERKRGQFLYTGSGNFVCSGRVLEQVRPCLELDCEFLSVTIENVDDDEFFLVHPLTLLEAMPPPPPAFSAIETMRALKSPAYRREVFTRPMIFRDRRFPAGTDCVSGLEPVARDFRVQYLKLGLTGLDFRQVWTTG